ncbi:Methylthioribose-1-phosphate isomerase [bacterium HR17]|uniref:Translation initiation factor eIF2B subunit delta n=1 Tax=Candidatus Fervidibacter japonicus TaxID=2035412 RepID=A0A2H5XFD7_9BACT|nr:Methylthioribose-1-phosphate isomerase [bacterium HR17]
MDWQTSLQRLCDDRRSGASTLTRKAAHLFARIAKQVTPFDLIAAAERLHRAHPAMAPLWHLKNLVAASAEHPDQLGRALRDFVAALIAHEEAAVSHAAAWLPDGTVLTHSFSSLVFRALVHAHRSGKRIRVICPIALPGGEGRLLAQRVRRAGGNVLLVADLQAFAWLPQCSAMVIGADALCPDGLVHKVGTRPLAHAARQAGVPVWSIATSEKGLPLPWHEPMRGVAPPIAPLSIPQDRTLYDLTEWALITGVITEAGAGGESHRKLWGT